MVISGGIALYCSCACVKERASQYGCAQRNMASLWVQIKERERMGERGCVSKRNILEIIATHLNTCSFQNAGCLGTFKYNACQICLLNSNHSDAQNDIVVRTLRDAC